MSPNRTSELCQFLLSNQLFTWNRLLAFHPQVEGVVLYLLLAGILLLMILDQVASMMSMISLLRLRLLGCLRLAASLAGQEDCTGLVWVESGCILSRDWQMAGDRRLWFFNWLGSDANACWPECYQVSTRVINDICNTGGECRPSDERVWVMSSRPRGRQWDSRCREDSDHLSQRRQ